MFKGINGQENKGNEKKIDILLANDASNAQGWIAEDGDDEVEPGSGITLPLVGEAAGADEFIEPRRSGRNEVRDLEEEFESDNEAVEENVEFESNNDSVFELEEYVVEDEELDS
ncbi:hypothetical protein LWI28_009408 [Acer negundo]|uniref:Uncharacterized protein n=1 Tax=Acer negundo TaxID=4023 RepID=A0AAD5IL34_ACENE|nr:hypothetical protein LWI28_009408 [Acer negundo]